MADLVTADVQRVEGAAGTHSYSLEETKAFANFINNNLGSDEALKDLLPLNPMDESLFSSVHDGTLLCKLLNFAVPNTIDERAVNWPHKKNRALNNFEIGENQNVAVNSAKAVGCSTVNIGAEDMTAGTPHLVLGLVWQVMKLALFSEINLTHHPELYRLLEDGEELSDFMKLPAEHILIRWFNFHLAAAGWERRVKDFSGSIKDGENYTVLLAQIAPEQCNRGPLSMSPEDRAEAVIAGAAKLGVERFIQPSDITNGISKLNLAFVAALFNNWPALEVIESEEQLRELRDVLDEDDESMGREERAFRNWINNLGIEGTVDRLFDDLRDGVILLQVLDHLKPGCVEWKKVNKTPNNTWKKSENCNKVIDIIQNSLGMKLVGIDGNNLVEGHKMYTLAVMWRLMEYHIVGSVSGLDEKGILSWANGRAGSTIGSFRAKELKTSKWLADLLFAIDNRVIDHAEINEGSDDEERMANAKYVITAARKLCTVYALPEDILEVKQKLIFHMVATLYTVDHE
ncbi:Calponin [Carpediemonas membranifera]|uniref:Calponin n=1 Tax=Carpediemonas membranifera TaxID=201153 RepID=A0A8J6B5L8_9EUKA|nr:Calponin [Carpediemonas membranifera]|eukprot:KAG9393347.1 Calponin [Carpediemonas membranifera]